MQLFKKIAIQSTFVFMMVAFFFGTPKAVESTATPLQSLYMIKEMVPQVKRVGLMWQQSNYTDSNLMTDIKRASAATGTEVVVEDVESLPQVASEFRDLVNEYHVQVLWVVRNDDIMNNSITRSYLIKNSAISGIALFAPNTDWVSSGACAAVVTDGGTTKLVVNQRTMNALGLKVPEKYASITQFLANK